MLDFIIDYFASTYDVDTSEIKTRLIAFLLDYGTTAAIFILFTTSLYSAIKISKKNNPFSSGLLSRSTPAFERSLLITAGITLVSYMISTLGMHTYSLFNTGQPSGIELHLFYISMEALTILFIIFGHTYIRTRLAFVSELLCYVMITSGFAHTMLYLSFLIINTQIALSFDDYANSPRLLYKISASLFVVSIYGGAAVMVVACLAPYKVEKLQKKLKAKSIQE
jgi:hypothetical protein